MTEQELNDINKIHSKLSTLFNGTWGIDWTYCIDKSVPGEVKVIIILQIKGRMRVEVIGHTLESALENAYFFLSQSLKESRRLNNAPQPKETYTPSAYDMEQMTEYFTRHPAHYKEYFAKQISQSQPAFGMLTEEQRIRLCIIWKQYKQTINNE